MLDSRIMTILQEQLGKQIKFPNTHDDVDLVYLDTNENSGKTNATYKDRNTGEIYKFKYNRINLDSFIRRHSEVTINDLGYKQYILRNDNYTEISRDLLMDLGVSTTQENEIELSDYGFKLLSYPILENCTKSYRMVRYIGGEVDYLNRYQSGFKVIDLIHSGSTIEGGIGKSFPKRFDFSISILSGFTGDRYSNKTTLFSIVREIDKTILRCLDTRIELDNNDFITWKMSWFKDGLEFEFRDVKQTIPIKTRITHPFNKMVIEQKFVVPEINDTNKVYIDYHGNRVVTPVKTNLVSKRFELTRQLESIPFKKNINIFVIPLNKDKPLSLEQDMYSGLNDESNRVKKVLIAYKPCYDDPTDPSILRKQILNFFGIDRMKWSLFKYSNSGKNVGVFSGGKYRLVKSEDYVKHHVGVDTVNGLFAININPEYDSESNDWISEELKHGLRTNYSKANNVLVVIEVDSNYTAKQQASIFDIIETPTEAVEEVVLQADYGKYVGAKKDHEVYYGKSKYPVIVEPFKHLNVRLNRDGTVDAFYNNNKPVYAYQFLAERQFSVKFKGFGDGKLAFSESLFKQSELENSFKEMFVYVDKSGHLHHGKGSEIFEESVSSKVEYMNDRHDMYYALEDDDLLLYVGMNPKTNKGEVRFIYRSGDMITIVTYVTKDVVFEKRIDHFDKLYFVYQSLDKSETPLANHRVYFNRFGEPQ